MKGILAFCFHLGKPTLFVCLFVFFVCLFCFLIFCRCCELEEEHYTDFTIK